MAILISRDPEFGKSKNPQPLNRYIYCLNNPLKYIDPDGRDPCGPDWLEKNNSPSSGLDTDFWGLMLLLFLELLEEAVKDFADAYVIADSTYYDGCAVIGLGFLLSLTGVVGSLIALLIGYGYLLVSEIAGPTCLKLWNDPQFRNLLSVAKNYANLACYDDRSQTD